MIVSIFGLIIYFISSLFNVRLSSSYGYKSSFLLAGWDMIPLLMSGLVIVLLSVALTGR